MKIYLDYVFFINFIFDFIIIYGVNIILKRNAKINKIIIGSIVGAFSIFILFIPLSQLVLFFLKLLFGFLMIIISFKYKDYKYTLNNFLYLMILSIIVGGFLYMINIEVGYEHIGFVFYKNGFGLNIFILLLLSILIIIIYINISKKHKNIDFYYKVIIYLNNKKYYLTGFLDTGNNLRDPYLNKPILILNKDYKLDLSKQKFIYVPFKALNHTGLIQCYFIDKIFIERVGFKYNYLLGISNDKLSLSGIDIILNNNLKEDI